MSLQLEPWTPTGFGAPHSTGSAEKAKMLLLGQGRMDGLARGKRDGTDAFHELGEIVRR